MPAKVAGCGLRPNRPTGTAPGCRRHPGHGWCPPGEWRCVRGFSSLLLTCGLPRLAPLERFRHFAMARILPLSGAVEEVVRDGDKVAFEGFTHLIPYAAGHEAIRQKRKDLTLVRMTPDLIYDQLIGVGAVRKMI